MVKVTPHPSEVGNFRTAVKFSAAVLEFRLVSRWLAHVVSSVCCSGVSACSLCFTKLLLSCNVNTDSILLAKVDVFVTRPQFHYPHESA